MIPFAVLKHTNLRNSRKSLAGKGARPCRRPAAVLGKFLNPPQMRYLLRLVEDDTAALRDFQTAPKCWPFICIYPCSSVVLIAPAKDISAGKRRCGWSSAAASY